MNTKEQILLSIRDSIKEVLPEAAIVLFGSRANNTDHEESDWDILVLTNQPVTREIRKKIHENVFPLGVSIGSFINVLLVARSDWQQSPGWYALRKNIALNSIPL